MDSDNTNVNIFDKILYTVEYIVLIGVSMVVYSFLVFFISDKLNVGALGIIILFAWIVSIFAFNSIAANFVYKDVKKLQAQGVIVGNTPIGWASIVFLVPTIGLASYLAIRRADYKKQLQFKNSQIDNIKN